MARVKHKKIVNKNASHDEFCWSWQLPLFFSSPSKIAVGRYRVNKFIQTDFADFPKLFPAFRYYIQTVRKEKFKIKFRPQRRQKEGRNTLKGIITLYFKLYLYLFIESPLLPCKLLLGFIQYTRHHSISSTQISNKHSTFGAPVL